MASSAIKTQGTVITVGESTIDQVTDFTTPSDTYNEIDITNMSTVGRKEFVAGLCDGGEFTFSYIVPESGGIDSSDDIVACSVANGAVSVSFMGYIKNAGYKGSIDGVITQDVSVRVTGDVA